MATDGRRTYTPEQREEALRLYADLGPAETGRQMGIPSNTIRQWARRAGVTGPRAKQVAKAVEASKAAMSERRSRLAEDLMGDVECLRMQLWEPCVVHHFTSDGEMATGELAQPTFSDQVRILTSLGIAVDKLQLLSGEPTARNENITIDERRARVKNMRDELAERRKAKAA